MFAVLPKDLLAHSCSYLDEFHTIAFAARANRHWHACLCSSPSAFVNAIPLETNLCAQTGPLIRLVHHYSVYCSDNELQCIADNVGKFPFLRSFRLTSLLQTRALVQCSSVLETCQFFSHFDQSVPLTCFSKLKHLKLFYPPYNVYACNNFLRRSKFPRLETVSFYGDCEIPFHWLNSMSTLKQVSLYYHHDYYHSYTLRAFETMNNLGKSNFKLSVLLPFDLDKPNLTRKWMENIRIMLCSLSVESKSKLELVLECVDWQGYLFGKLAKLPQLDCVKEVKIKVFKATPDKLQKLLRVIPLVFVELQHLTINTLGKIKSNPIKQLRRKIPSLVSLTMQ